MTAIFYKFGSNKHGFFIQDKEIDFKRNLTKKELFKIVDLRHPVLNEKDYFEILLNKKSFLSNQHYIIIS